MNENNLFRKEVIINKKNTHYGTVSINAPVSCQIIIFAVFILVILIILFFTNAEFSEKFIVRGYVNSTKGIALVYPARNGVIIKSYVQHDQAIKKGDELFVIDTSYDGLNKNSHHELFTQLKKRKHAIEKDINEKKAQLLSLHKLLLKKYISLTTYNEKKQEIFALENNLNSVEMEIIRYKQESSYSVRAPVDGTIASILFKKGQYANFAKPLLKILPAHADLIAELFIPINQAGFLSRDNKIIIRYDAYPYERFGTYQATISEISLSVLTDNEEDKPLRIGQPYYKVTARLSKESVMLYGEERKIQHGMTLTAVVVGSKRKLWRWILDPLFSYYGELVV